ncbi:hypothetical protein DH2020_031736 [Rehmannia glutinosa]|uniref:Methyltransferase type 11 domain-containing protein n=1 Tax=Rehmannia glutinosa TaxID=99300 RepID=A0ABR0VKF7_REHGL
MGKTGRDWTQIYAIYDTTISPHPRRWIFDSLPAIPLLLRAHLLLPAALPPGPASARFAAGFTGSVTALSAVCLFFAAANFFYSAVSLHWDMSQRIVSSVHDWSSVKHVLDLGCGRGILLNAVALQLKKSGSSGRVVGLNPTRSQNRAISPTRTLRTAGLEGVQEYVTCRAGDPRTLPFSDSYFDVVVSAVFLHTVGKEFGPKSSAAAAERMRVLGEVVRVLKPGGVGVVWDLVHVPEYVQRLNELKMEEIRVSERVTAFMVSSHIVSFRKPRQHFVGSDEVRLDWRFNNLG